MSTSVPPPQTPEPGVIEAPRRVEGELFGHPKGLYVLFFTELWERFSFYSMRAFLVLYTAYVLFAGAEEGEATRMSSEIYGAYLGFVYAAPFFGGMLADRLLGQRRAIYIGGVLMALAQFTLAAHALMRETASPLVLHMIFFGGLGLLSAGNGFFKPNISTIVGTLYPANDSRRDGAFTIFYMGINIGAFLAGISGQIAQVYGWHWGFLIAGVGMLAGLVIFRFGRSHLGDHGLPPRKGMLKEARYGLPNVLLLTLGVIVFIAIAAYLIARPAWVQNLSVFIAVPILLYLIWEITRGTREEAGRMIVILVLCSFSMLFWAFFELAGSAINLFADQQVDRTVGGFEFQASFLTASINPLFIILLGIPFARLWVWLAKRQAEPSSPLKFALGLLQLALGFLLLYFGAIEAQRDGKSSMIWLVLGFFFHTTGELCLSPVGLSTMTKLSPARLVGMFMGVWFLASSLGNIFGGWVGGLAGDAGFAQVFFWIAVTGAGASVLLFLLVPFLKRMMYGVK